MATYKSTDPIAPFPDHINREKFAGWLSGFVDSEGSFDLHVLQFKLDHSQGQPRCGFFINLRADDIDALVLIRSFWGVGMITERYPCNNRDIRECEGRQYKVQVLKDLVSVVIPHFEEYPLYAKKRHDYAIWKQGVMLAKNRHRLRGKRWIAEDRNRFIELVNELRRVRLYQPTDPVKIVEPVPNNHRSLKLPGFDD